MGFLSGLGLKGRALGLALGSLLSAGGVTLVSCELPSLFGAPAASFPATQAFTLALDVTELPDAEPAPLGITNASDAYAWPDRALVLTEAFGDAPPDHAFPMGNVETWAWKSKDGYIRYIEPLEVGVREYYYAPGEEQPFYVRDPEYGYGFNNGMLVVVVDRGGRVLPPRDMVIYARPAGRYLARADHLYEAGRGRQRWRVTPDRWARRAPVLAEGAAEWRQAASTQENWRNYRARSPDSAHFANERRRRQDAARRSQEQYVRQTRNGDRPRQVATAAPPEPRRWADVERRDRVRGGGGRDVGSRDMAGRDMGGMGAGDGGRGDRGDRGGRQQGERAMAFDDGPARGSRRQAGASPNDPSFAVDPQRGARGQGAARDRAQARREAAEQRRAAGGMPQDRTRPERNRPERGFGRDGENQRRAQASEERRQAQNQAQNQARAEARNQGRQQQAMEQRGRDQADRQRRQAENQARQQAQNQARQQAQNQARQQAAEQQRQQNQMAQQQQQQQRQAEREARQQQQQAERRNRNNNDDDGGGRRRRRDGGG